MHEVAIVGGGAAGLSTAALLGERGLQAVVLEAEPELGGRWARRYDRLHLHTPRLLSGLPGVRIPRSYGRWVARDGVVSYLQEYAPRRRLDVRLGTPVERIDRDDVGWRLETSQEPVHGQRVVVATGYHAQPFVPPWPGVESFPGRLVHSAEYRNPESYRGLDVLVVGPGNSGSEIAVDLAEGGASRVRLSVRTPPQITRRDSFGIPAQAIGIAVGYLPRGWVDPLSKALRRLTIPDLAEYGLPRPSEGLLTQYLRTGVTPVLDVGLVDAVRSRRVEVVAAVERFEDGEVVLADGTRLAPDAIVAATGFRPALEPLVGHLGVLDERGLPRPRDAAQPAAPGLWFIGLRPELSGLLRQVGREARRIVDAIVAEGDAASARSERSPARV
jgi:putative flavoprotein involved in K+ transport